MNFKAEKIILSLYSNEIYEIDQKTLYKDIMQEMREIGSRSYMQSGQAIDYQLKRLEYHFYYLQDTDNSIKLK